MPRSRQAALPDVWIVGGEDVHLRLPFVRRLQARGFSTVVCGTMRSTAFEEAGVAFLQYPLSRRLAPFADAVSLLQLRKLFRVGKPGIVHAFDTKPALLAPFAAAMGDVPVCIRTITGMGSVFSSSSIYARALQLVYRVSQRRAGTLCRMTVFQNTDDRDYFLSHGLVEQSRQALIPGSGVDFDHLLDARTRGESLRLKADLGLGDRVICMMISRLVREKGVDEFLRAARLVRRSNPSAVFVLVGPVDTRGPNAVPLQEIADYKEDVLYLGERDDVPQLLGLADVFVLPTRYREGVPRVLLEAGALGVPLVTTDMPGCRDVVRHGWNGLIVMPGDYEELASTLERLLEQPELRSEMGTRAAIWIKDQFGISSVTQAYAELYERLWREHVHG